MKRNELQAMIDLLDDPDNEIHTLITKTFLDKGVDIIPELEKAWEISNNSTIQYKLEDIIHRIQLNYVQQSFQNWIKNGAADLLEGACIIAKYQYPELNLYEILNEIDKIKNSVIVDLNDNLTALEKVKLLNQLIYDSHKFSSNTTNYYSPQNSYINQVIFSKKGNPISLGIVYMSVAQKFGIPIFGVNLPKNFILAYKDEFYGLLNPSTNNDNILFYINPFNRGAILGRKEINQFLKQQNIEQNEIFYQPCSNLDIIRRLLLNLIYSYEKLGYESKISDFKDLLKLSKIADDNYNGD